MFLSWNWSRSKEKKNHHCYFRKRTVVTDEGDLLIKKRDKKGVRDTRDNWAREQEGKKKRHAVVIRSQQGICNFSTYSTMLLSLQWLEMRRKTSMLPSLCEEKAYSTLVKITLCKIDMIFSSDPAFSRLVYWTLKIVFSVFLNSVKNIVVNLLDQVTIF